jgi:hypothetical protein
LDVKPFKSIKDYSNRCIIWDFVDSYDMSSPTNSYLFFKII